MRTILTLMAFLWTGMYAAAQGWNPTEGPRGADVTVMTANESTLLVATQPGFIYRHDIDGWNRVAEMRVKQLYAFEDIFAASTIDGIYISADRGSSWQPVGPNGDDFRLAMDGRILYAAVDSTIYRIGEQGVSWMEVATAPEYFFSFFVHDSVILLSRGGHSSGLYRSGDRGKSWARVETGLPLRVPAQSFHERDGALYIGTDVHGVFRSIDGGRSWSEVNTGLPKFGNAYPLFEKFITFNGEIWGAGRDGTYSFADSTWQLRHLGSDRTITTARGGVLRGSRGGVEVTTDSGRSWHTMNWGLRAYRIDALTEFRGTVLAAAGGSIHRTQDLGNSWSRVNDISVIRFANGGNILYAIGENFFTPGLFRTTDGLDWGPAGQNLPQEPQWLSALAAGGDTVFVGYYRTAAAQDIIWMNGGAYRSVDRGVTWSAVNNGLPVRNGVVVPVLDLLTLGRTVLAQTADGIYRSPDGGDNWSRVNGLPDNARPGRLTRLGTKLFVAGSNAVYVSTDDGINWSLTGAGLPAEGYINNVSAVRGAVYVSMNVGEHVGRIYRLTGNGWVDVTNRFPDEIRIRGFIEIGDWVMAGTTWNSVWRGTLEPASYVPGDGAVKDVVRLGTAPNPFRSETSVGLTMKERGNVRLALISSLGQELAVLHDGALDAGNHEIKVDGTSLPAGVYHIRLENGNGIQTTMVIKTR